ncbi:hypothetical protein [Arsukibacterium sp.]|uniref:hypothetical protein n=1 Tax=Arsukibacterium sp. TaxID=1977258 RepID=UPI001BD41C9D|nr:hypothetical protein [Arsukibacterium sp.]
MTYGGAGIIALLPVLLLSILINTIWFIKGNGSRSWKIRVLLIYVAMIIFPWFAPLFLGWEFVNNSLIFEAGIIVSVLLLVFGGFAIPAISNSILRKQSETA